MNDVPVYFYCILLEQEDNRGTTKTKIPFLLPLAERSGFLMVYNLSNHQSTHFHCYNCTKATCMTNAVFARILFIDWKIVINNWIYTMKKSRNVDDFLLYTIIYIAVTMVIIDGQAEDKCIAFFIFLRKIFVS